MVNSYTCSCKCMYVTTYIVYAPTQIYVILQLDTITLSLSITTVAMTNSYTYLCKCIKLLHSYTVYTFMQICIALQLDTWSLLVSGKDDNNISNLSAII